MDKPALKESDNQMLSSYKTLKMRFEEQRYEIIKMNKRLLTEIREREAKEEELQEAISALKCLLKLRDQDRMDLQKNISKSFKHIVFPYMEKLKKTTLIGNNDYTPYIDIIESNVENIVSPFCSKLTTKNICLTQTEIQVANLVKEGKRDKEIAEILYVSIETVKTHRRNIRRKLGIRNNKSINLRSYLLQMDQ